MFSFWGCTVKPMSTPSETCLPHHLTITVATLDPEAVTGLPEGTRISVWATQKERGPRGTSVTVGKTLICTLQSGRCETVACKTQFHCSTLLSFSVQPQKGSCGVHLAGFFDHKYDKAPDVGDQMTWSEFQALLADARAMEEEEGEDEAEDEAAEQAGTHLSAAPAEEEEGRRPVRAVRRDAAKKQPAGVGQGEEPAVKAPAGKGVPATRGHKLAAEEEAVGGKRKRGSAGESSAGKPSGGVKLTKTKTVKLREGVSYADEELGWGKVVKSGSSVTLQVREVSGRKAEGKEQTRRFMVGLRKVASGLDDALVGMRAGGKRTVTLDADNNDAAVIPGWSTDTPITLSVVASKVD